MQKIIGLDIGSYSIKAVEIVNTFKSYELEGFYENVIPSLDELPGEMIVPACMEQLFRENNLQADRIVTAMPGQYISSRILSFPFSDPRKIQAAVFVEIEEMVPFNLDDMIIDHQLLGAMGGRTYVLVVMTKKSFLKTFLDHLQRIDIDPKVIDIDSLAFYNLWPFLKVQSEECVALVDVGHDKTSVCIVKDGLLKMFRSINLGGRYLTEFLARDLEVSFNEAQRFKHKISRVSYAGDSADELKGDDKVVVDRMTLASNAIVKELGRSFYAFKTWDKTPVDLLLLSGGTSKIKNFDNYLSEQLQVQVQKTHINESDLKMNENLNQYIEVMPQSTAIGIRAVTSLKRHSTINLRKGEFAYSQSYEALVKAVSVAAKIVSAALVLLMASYVVQYFIYTSQTDKLQAQYKQEFKRINSESRKILREKNFSKLRKKAERSIVTEIEKMRGSVTRFQKLNVGSGALSALSLISYKMPEKVKVDVTLYEFRETEGGDGRITLKGETDGYESVSNIVDSLRSIEQFSEVEEKSSAPKPGTDNKVIDFTLQIQYSPSSGDKA